MANVISPGVDARAAELGFAVRQAAPADAPELLLLMRDLFCEDAWSEVTLLRSLVFGTVPGSPHTYRVLLDGSGRVCGFGGVRTDGGGRAVILTVGVRRDTWGTGAGSFLLGLLLSTAERAGCDRVTLNVRTDNHRAQSLYRRHGFQAVRVNEGFYTASRNDSLLMERRTG
ncbi:GNAT family N-acetyltransferase [Streptomyces erythrochromogenes]|uniref:GNAT family N-acetyltransferase n=1 Tax=Streptomyces erythrochromogenes TaxID=285574 RepID=UPI0034150288